MTDRADNELLELAAKAAGIDAMWRPNVCVGGEWLAVPVDDGWMEWNPLADDGDALRLAVRLNLHINIDTIGSAQVEVIHYATDDPFGECFNEKTDADANAATRRAIVRAAAEIGSAA
jgi:hypothetical protein